MAVDDPLAPTRLSRRARIVVGVLALAAVLAVVGSAVVLVRARRTERTREILLEAGQGAGLVARPPSRRPGASWDIDSTGPNGRDERGEGDDIVLDASSSDPR